MQKTAAHEEDRLATLSRRCDDLESKLRTLPSEWQDTLDRIEHVLGRLNKRAARAREAEAAEPEANGQPVDAADRILRIRRNRGG